MYQYVLDRDVVEIVLSLPFRQRDEFVRIFRELAQNPYEKGENSFVDPLGREIERKRFGSWLISFWADHAMKEVRIVGIQKMLR